MKKPIYRYDRRELKFFLEEMTSLEAVSCQSPFDVGLDDLSRISDTTQRLAVALGEAYMTSDRDGATMRNGKVVLPKGYETLWKNYVTHRLEYDAMTLPYELQQMRMEMLLGANPSFMTYGGFNSPAIKLLAKYGTQEQKDMFLEKLETMAWDACLCLTEQDAGSDISMISSRAHRVDAQTHHLTGEKIFISAGMHDLTENTVYLVLARDDLDEADSYQTTCFLVPKYWPEKDGTFTSNNVSCLKIDSKMGLKGCANARLAFGKDGPTKALPLGNQHHIGLLQVRSVMQEARMGTGLFALGMASSAYLHAKDYAENRLQGRSFMQPFDVSAPRRYIIAHPDIQRMLLEMKALVEGCRGVIGALSEQLSSIAIAEEKGDNAALQRHKALAGFYTPIVKAYVSDQAWRVAELSMQVHGGVGYLSDLPIEQYARDIRVLSIWEGTNYIQAQDLVREKLKFGRDSVTLSLFIDDCDAFIRSGQNYPAFNADFAALKKARDALLEVMAHVARISSIPETAERVSQYCTRILHMFGAVIVARTLLKAAMISADKLNARDVSPSDRKFYVNKIEAAQFFIRNLLPLALQICAIISDAETYVGFSFQNEEIRESQHLDGVIA